jgi:transcriptional regulator with XRE-family HTH domain
LNEAREEPLSEAQEEPLRIGKRLKAQRVSVGMKMRELAAEVGCSESLISKIENDKASPSLATLHKLVAALGTNVAYLFDGGDPPGVIFRAGERPIIDMGERKVKLERVVPYGDDRLIQANIHIISPGASSEGTVQHKGEEMGFVLEGSIVLTVDDEHHRLKPGDSFLFRSERFHEYHNPGRKTARVLWVNTPATF